MTIAEAGGLWGRLKWALGLRPSEARQEQMFAERLASTKRNNVAALEEIKKRIAGLEDRLRDLKKEFDAAKGGKRRVLAGEIERTCRDLDRVAKLLAIVERNLEQIDAIEAKLAEIEAARKKGASEQDVDALNDRVRGEFERLERSDRAQEDLDKLVYKGPEPVKTDVEERLAELDATGDAGLLSESARKRLEDLNTGT